MSVVINRLQVFSVIILHLAVKLSSKFQSFKQRIIEPQISIIHIEENFSFVKTKNPTVTVGSSLFFSFLAIGSFLVHFGSRESQLYFLLPAQHMLLTVLFPAFVIASNKKVRNQFFGEQTCLGQLWIYCSQNNKITPFG